MKLTRGLGISKVLRHLGISGHNNPAENLEKGLTICITISTATDKAPNNKTMNSYMSKLSSSLTGKQNYQNEIGLITYDAYCRISLEQIRFQRLKMFYSYKKCIHAHDVFEFYFKGKR